MNVTYKDVSVELKDLTEETITKAAIEWEQKKHQKDREPDEIFAGMEFPDEPLAGSGRQSFIDYIERAYK